MDRIIIYVVIVASMFIIGCGGAGGGGVDVGNVGTSGDANDITITVSSTPSAPSGLNATAVSASQIDLQWQDNSTNEDGFWIERKNTSTGSYTQIAIAGADVESFSDTGLSAVTTYY
ncbi:MAG: fibronectin type III domain-containing protein [Planctomycetes bacterium]|nr:fibronectin type III domain-containing protein [Planctomycetota bacterium]